MLQRRRVEPAAEANLLQKPSGAQDEKGLPATKKTSLSLGSLQGRPGLLVCRGRAVAQLSPAGRTSRLQRQKHAKKREKTKLEPT